VAGRWYRAVLRPVAVLVCLGAAVTLPGGAPAAGTLGRQALRVLQLNLCASGIAGCYTGRSVPEAAAVVRAEAPDLVTLNEVCARDVPTMAAAMAGSVAGATAAGTVVSVFAPAADRRTGGPFRCLDGQEYGIGLLLRLPEGRAGHRTTRGLYPTQDTRDPEERVWVCVDTDVGFAACTTHLASTSATVALAQCRYLTGTVLPSVRAPVVLGGDLNLGDLSRCAPPGYPHVGDGGVQHVLASPEFTVASVVRLDLAGTTDHPGLLLELVRQGTGHPA
jgi:hypothetical protein